MLSQVIEILPGFLLVMPMDIPGALEMELDLFLLKVFMLNQWGECAWV